MVYEDNKFENIYDVFSRYDTLQRINGDLVRAVERNEHETERLKNTNAKFIKEKQNERLVLESKLVDHKKTLEKLQVEGTTKEQELYENEGLNKQKVSLYLVTGTYVARNGKYRK